MVQLGEALTDPTLDPPVRALVVYNSNPATIAPDQGRVLAGLRRDDLFTVVLEHVMTDTARHADYVLPATTQLEHWDLLWSWGQPYLTLNQPAIEPQGGALPNTEIFRRLAARLGFDEPYWSESDEEMIRRSLATGHPLLGGATFDDLRERGWIRLATPADGRPFAEGGFPTRSGRCEFYSEKLAERGYDPLPNWLPASASPERAAYPLALVAAKSALHFLNSSYAGLDHHRNAEGEPLLEIHPFDAGPRDIRDGARVRVINERGSVEAMARIGARVRPGVVSLPFGWWASQSPGGASANALTPSHLADWGGGGAFHDAFVEVVGVDRGAADR
jgi:anaerobic selenocysteine-containing dehydrogenase